MRAGALVAALLVAGCAPGIEEGRYGCAADSDCPEGWFCRADLRCWRTPGDGATDGGGPDSGADGGADGGADAGGDGGGDAATDAGPDAGTDACLPRAVDIDVLVMIDKSASMVQNQALLASAFPPLIDALATGDFDGDGARDVPRIDTLHVGVITSDLGAHGNSVFGCEEPLGDDAELVTERLAGSVRTGCDGPFPRYLEYARGGSTSALTDAFSCLAEVGATGCGFEQQLDAVLKALVTDDDPYLFYDGSLGHGDDTNAGFLREGSILVTLLLTDEDDCSTGMPLLYSTSEGPYAGTELQVRCYEHADEALYSLERYRDGLIGLRGDPADLVFAAVTGMPVRVAGEDAATILEAPEMAYVIGESEVEPACTSGDGRSALPGRRIVGLADELADRGAGTVLRSICEPDFTEMRRDLLTALAPRIRARTCE